MPPFRRITARLAAVVHCHIMAIERHFLGWDSPCLTSAVQWLRQRYERDGVLDLSGTLLVTPGGRAGRRLLELLAEPGELELHPPAAILTLGDLPERLYRVPPPWRRCDDLRSLLLRTLALRQFDRNTLRTALPDLPQPDDWVGCFDLATELAQLDATLESEQLGFAGALKHLETLEDFPDLERWSVLAELQAAYEAILAQRQLLDVHRARRLALRQQWVQCPQSIVLIGTLDMSGVARAMLQAVDAPVTALVHAPAELASAYDELGKVRPEAWRQRPLALDPQQVRIVDQPLDQVHEALRVMARLGEPRRPLPVDQVTIGLGDETMAPMVQRTLELAGVPARQPAGVGLHQTPPALLLSAAASWMERRRPQDLAALLRHPDVEAWLHAQLPQHTAPAWCSRLDDYVSRCLPARVEAPWLGDDRHAELAQAVDKLQELWPTQALQPAPLPSWSEPILQLLRTTYGQRTLHRVGDEALIDALGRLRNALGDQADLDPADAATPALTLPAAIRLLLSRLGGQKLAPEPSAAAVELLGWLELQLDDAPTLIALGLNEGLVPQSLTSDAFLPDSLRTRLKLPDNALRYARDRAALEAILHSRRHVTLVAGRRNGEGDPLLPSRLLLAADAAELPARVLAFCQEERHAPAPLRLLPGGDACRLIMPPPDDLRDALASLRVTAFRDYLACPYRFYLKHVLKLDSQDDSAVELDSLSFGTLAHDVLCELSKGPIAEPDARVVRAWLSDELDRQVNRRFGAKPRAAVALQREVLRQRLAVLADWQARQVQAGWRTVRVEVDMEGDLLIDEQPLHITGRIDRIDQHPEHGYRILDYKTGDTPADPVKQHQRGRSGDREWVDLQLPLYHHLAPQNHIGEPIALGYVRLCKDPASIGLAEARWSADELRGAVDKAIEVGRAIRAGVFWPPSSDRFDDEWSALCMEGQMTQAQAMRRVQELLARRQEEARP